MKGILLSILFLSGLFSTPLFAQAELTGELTIDSVAGYVIQMHMDVTNTGNQAFSYTFTSSETSFYSIDGVEIHEMSLPVMLPFTLEPGAVSTFSMMSMTPLTSGAHVIQAFLNLATPLAIGTPQTVFIGEAIAVTIGSGDALSRIPIDFFWRTTLYECIYTAEELNHQAGWITAISLYNNFTQDAFLQQSIYIYLARVGENNLSQGWVDPDELVTVFHGTVDFPMGTNEVMIPMNEGLYYNGNTNLALAVLRPIPLSYQVGAEPFCVQAADSLRSRKKVSDSIALYAMNPPTPNPNQFVGYMPKITFHILPDPTESDDETQMPFPIVVNHYPNPIRSTCTFMVKSDKPISPQIEIYNLRGQKIQTITGMQKAVEHNLHWNTLDAVGKSCPSGIYLCRIRTGSAEVLKKVILLH